MADTRYLTVAVEQHVRDVLSASHKVRFVKRVLPLVSGGQHEFDAVAEDGSVVGAIKSASGRTAGGKNPSGKIKDCFAELYFLSLVEAPDRVLYLTTSSFYDLFLRTMRDKIAPGLRVVHLPLPLDIQAQVDAVQKAASDEVFSVLDQREQRAVVASD